MARSHLADRQGGHLRVLTPAMSDEPIEQSRVAVELGTETEPGLIRFSNGPPPTGISSFDSYALRTTAGWVFIDPVRPTLDGVDRLRRLIREPPVATVLTSDGHARFCYAVRQTWGPPVWGPTPGLVQRPVGYRGRSDHRYSAGHSLLAVLRAIKP